MSTAQPTFLQEPAFRNHLERLLRFYPYTLFGLLQLPEGVEAREILPLVQAHFRSVDRLDPLDSRHLLLILGVPGPTEADRILERLQSLLHRRLGLETPRPLVGGLLIQQIPKDLSTLWVWLLRALRAAPQHLERRALLSPHAATRSLVQALPVPHEPHQTLFQGIQAQGGLFWVTGGDVFGRYALLLRVAYDKYQQGFEVLLAPGLPSPFLPLYPLLYPLGSHPRWPLTELQRLLGDALPLLAPLLQRYHPQEVPFAEAGPVEAEALVHGARHLLQSLAQQIPTIWVVPEVAAADLETQVLVQRLLQDPPPGLTLLLSGPLAFETPEELRQVSLRTPEHIRELLGEKAGAPPAPSFLYLWLLNPWKVRHPGEPLPDNLDALLQDLVSRLPSRALEALRRLALLQKPMTATLLAPCLNLSPAEAEELLGTLRSLGLVLEDLGVFFFPDPEVPRRLLQHLSPEERRSLHQEMYRCLLERLPSPFPDLWQAEQAGPAGEGFAAVRHWTQFAGELFQVYAWRSGHRALLQGLQVQRAAGIPPQRPLLQIPLDRVLYYRHILSPHDPALKLLDSLARELETQGYLEEWAVLQDWLTFQELQHGWYDDAEARAGATYRKIHTEAPHLEALALHLVGSCHWYQDRLSKAKAFWLRALRRSDAIPPLQRARLLGNLGMVHEEEGDLAQALKFYQSAIEIFSEQQVSSGLATGSGLMARVEMKQGHLGRALELFERALYCARQMRHQADEALWSTHLALLYLDLGVYSQALSMIQRAHELFQTLRNPYHIRITRGIEGEIELLRGREEQGQKILESVLREAQEAGDTEVVLQVYHNWLKTLLSLDRLEETQALEQRYKIHISHRLRLWQQALQTTPATLPAFLADWQKLKRKADALLELADQRFLLEALQRGRDSRFLPRLQEVYRFLLDLAQTLEDPALQRAFLTRNPHAVRIRSWASAPEES